MTDPTFENTFRKHSFWPLVEFGLWTAARLRGNAKTAARAKIHANEPG